MKVFLLLFLTAFRVAFVGDPQVDDSTELGFARASVFAELLERKDLDLVVIMGDLVNEKTELLPACFGILDSLPCPWVRVQGNHDGKAIPADSSFVAGGIRFVLLNREDSPLPRERAGEKTVFCSHYPFGAVADSSSNCLYVSAHLHTVFREMKGGAQHLGVGASCGTWWRGIPDRHGIPYALMNCGARRGYFVAQFFPKRRRNWFRLEYKVIGENESVQGKAFVNDSSLVINLFGGAPFGSLEVRTPQGWRKAERLEAIDPEVQGLIELNRNTPRELKKRNRRAYIPMLRRNSPHLWELPLEEFAGKDGEKRQKVGAAPDSGGRQATEKRQADCALPAKGDRIRIRYRDASMRVKCEVEVQK